MRRILFTFAAVAVLLFGYAAPASAAPTFAASRCVVKYDSAGRRVVLCILPFAPRNARRYGA